jgi:hypothetical protein
LNFLNLEIWFSTRSFGLRRCAPALKIFERALALNFWKQKNKQKLPEEKGSIAPSTKYLVEVCFLLYLAVLC